MESYKYLNKERYIVKTFLNQKIKYKSENDGR